MDTIDDSEGVGAVGTEQTAADLEYGGNWASGEEEARVSGQAIPAFPFAIGVLTNAALKFSRNKQTPSIRVGFKIEEGIDGQEDATVFDDLYLSVSKEEPLDGKSTDGAGNLVMVPKSAEKLAEDVEAFQKRLNKVARILHLPLAGPKNRSQQALEAYASQFQDAIKRGEKAVIDVTIRNDRGQPQNRINWYGIRALDDKAVDKKLRAAGKTAAEEARQRITERAQKGGSGGTQGRTAGAMRRGAVEVTRID